MAGVFRAQASDGKALLHRLTCSGKGVFRAQASDGESQGRRDRISPEEPRSDGC